MRMRKDSLIDQRMGRRFGGGRRRYSPKVIAGAVLLLAIPLVATSLASQVTINGTEGGCLLYTSPSPRDRQKSRMPSSA